MKARRMGMMGLGLLLGWGAMSAVGSAGSGEAVDDVDEFKLPAVQRATTRRATTLRARKVAAPAPGTRLFRYAVPIRFQPARHVVTASDRAVTRAIRPAAALRKAGPADLAVLAVQPATLTVERARGGRWVDLAITVANLGRGSAHRVEVESSVEGTNWPAESRYLPYLRPGARTVVKTRVFVPGDARAGTHRLVVSLDPDKVNDDGNHGNEKKVLSLRIVEPRLPNLCFEAFKKNKKKGSRHWGALKRGYLKMAYDMTVANRGTKGSPSARLQVEVHQYDTTKKKSKRASRIRNWNFTVPPLAPGRTWSKRSDRFKALAKASYKVVAEIDPDERIDESNEDDNLARSAFSVKVKNPAKDWFVQAGRKIKKGAQKVGKAFYDAGEYVWKGIKKGSTAALAGIMVPEMMGWVEASYQDHKRFAKPLTAAEKQELKPYYPQSLLDRCRVHVVDRARRPEFWGDADGVTFKEVIVIRKGQRNISMLSHELVHSYQYQKLGLSKFCWRYIHTWVKSGFKYLKISLEEEAYGFQAEVAKGSPITLSEYLAY